MASILVGLFIGFIIGWILGIMVYRKFMWKIEAVARNIVERKKRGDE